MTTIEITETKTSAQRNAEEILDYFEKYPEKHYQDLWGRSTECGTTYCVAGYLAAFRGDTHWEEEMGTLSLNIDAEFDNFKDYGSYLGLDKIDAEMLFYNTTEEQALIGLRAIAAGEKIDWISMGLEEEYKYELDFYARFPDGA